MDAVMPPVGPAERPLIFGEVLFDRFPDGSEILGGAPFNVAWNLKGLGLDPLFLSRVGADPLGERIRAAMGHWGLDDSGLQADASHATGTVEVRLEGAEPSFDIVAPSAYDFIEWDGIPSEPAMALLYHGSLALRQERSRASLDRLVEQRARSVFLDVNLRRPWYELESIRKRLDTAHVAKLNEVELEELSPRGRDLDERARHLLSEAGLEELYVTRGERGAIALTAAGERREILPAAGTPVVDTVGAGDAFASVLILAALSGWSVEQTLPRAQEFAAAVVGLRGATVEDRDFYRPFRDAWSAP